MNTHNFFAFFDIGNLRKRVVKTKALVEEGDLGETAKTDSTLTPTSVNASQSESTTNMQWKEGLKMDQAVTIAQSYSNEFLHLPDWFKVNTSKRATLIVEQQLGKPSTIVNSKIAWLMNNSDFKNNVYVVNDNIDYVEVDTIASVTMDDTFNPFMGFSNEINRMKYALSKQLSSKIYTRGPIYRISNTNTTSAYSQSVGIHNIENLASHKTETPGSLVYEVLAGVTRKADVDLISEWTKLSVYNFKSLFFRVAILLIFTSQRSWTNESIIANERWYISDLTDINIQTYRPDMRDHELTTHIKRQGKESIHIFVPTGKEDVCAAAICLAKIPSLPIMHKVGNKYTFLNSLNFEHVICDQTITLYVQDEKKMRDTIRSMDQEWFGSRTNINKLMEFISTWEKLENVNPFISNAFMLEHFVLENEDEFINSIVMPKIIFPSILGFINIEKRVELADAQISSIRQLEFCAVNYMKYLGIKNSLFEILDQGITQKITLLGKRRDSVVNQFNSYATSILGYFESPINFRHLLSNLTGDVVDMEISSMFHLGILKMMENDINHIGESISFGMELPNGLSLTGAFTQLAYSNQSVSKYIGNWFSIPSLKVDYEEGLITSNNVADSRIYHALLMNRENPTQRMVQWYPDNMVYPKQDSYVLEYEGADKLSCSTVLAKKKIMINPHSIRITSHERLRVDQKHKMLVSASRGSQRTIIKKRSYSQTFENIIQDNYGAKDIEITRPSYNPMFDEEKAHEPINHEEASTSGLVDNSNGEPNTQVSKLSTKVFPKLSELDQEQREDDVIDNLPIISPEIVNELLEDFDIINTDSVKLSDSIKTISSVFPNPTVTWWTTDGKGKVYAYIQAPETLDQQLIDQAIDKFNDLTKQKIANNIAFFPTGTIGPLKHYQNVIVQLGEPTDSGKYTRISPNWNVYYHKPTIENIGAMENITGLLSNDKDIGKPRGFKKVPKVKNNLLVMNNKPIRVKAESVNRYNWIYNSVNRLNYWFNNETNLPDNLIPIDLYEKSGEYTCGMDILAYIIKKKKPYINNVSIEKMKQNYSKKFGHEIDITEGMDIDTFGRICSCYGLNIGVYIRGLGEGGFRYVQTFRHFTTEFVVWDITRQHISNYIFADEKETFKLMQKAINEYFKLDYSIEQYCDINKAITLIAQLEMIKAKKGTRWNQNKIIQSIDQWDKENGYEKEKTISYYYFFESNNNTNVNGLDTILGQLRII